MTTQKTNGKPQQVSTGSGIAKIETSVSLTVAKPEEKTVLAPLPVTPLEKSLQKIKEFIELQNKHTRLVLSSQKLDEFRLQKGEESIQLSLTDDNNRKLEFSTQNPEVLVAVIDCLRSTIQDKRKEVEARVMTIAA